MSGQTQILPGMQWTTQVNNKTQGVGVCVCVCKPIRKKTEREKQAGTKYYINSLISKAIFKP